MPALSERAARCSLELENLGVFARFSGRLEIHGQSVLESRAVQALVRHGHLRRRDVPALRDELRWLLEHDVADTVQVCFQPLYSTETRTSFKACPVQAATACCNWCAGAAGDYAAAAAAVPRVQQWHWRAAPPPRAAPPVQRHHCCCPRHHRRASAAGHCCAGSRNCK